MFFFILQIPTVLFPSRSGPTGSLLQGGIRAGAPDQSFPDYNKPVGRSQFVLRVALIGALFATLLQLARLAGPGVTAWELRIGVVLITFVWILSVEGRVLDAGLPRWVSIAYCLILPAMSALPHFLNMFNLHFALGLFVVLQIPTVFVQSRAPQGEPTSSDADGKDRAGLLSKRSREAVGAGRSLDGIEFAVYTLLIAGVWYVAHLLRGDAGRGPMSWAADLASDSGTLVLCVLWVICVTRRLRDSNLQFWAVDFWLFILVASMLPFAFGAINIQAALLIFAALQIPAVFIPRGSSSTGPLPVNMNS